MNYELEPFHRNTPLEDFLHDIKQIANELNKDTLSINEYNAKGKYAATTIIRRFGTWKKALEGAELCTNHIRDITNDDLFSNIENVWIYFGRQPRSYEIKQPISKFSIRPYHDRFGGWYKALEAFIIHINQEEKEEENVVYETESNKCEKSQHPIITTSSRHPSERMRFRILLRDGFTCKKCGRSPIKTRDVELHVDHIIPWSKGGKTIPDNLETKCKECNSGKGNAFNV